MVIVATSHSPGAKPVRGAKKLAFEDFDQGQRPSEIHIKGIKEATKYRYFQEWKKLRGLPPSPQGGTPSEGGPLAGAEKAGPGGASGLLDQFQAFKLRQQLEAEKEKLRERAQEILSTLEDAEEQYTDSGTRVSGWMQRRQCLEGQLRDFVLVRLGGIESEGDLKALAAVVDGLHRDMDALLDEYFEKIEEQEQLRRKGEMELSCNLLRESVDVSLFPAYAMEAVERRIVVRNKGEAEEVSQALCQWEVVYDTVRAEPDRKKQLWDAFLRGLEEGGWDFISHLKRQNDNLKWQIQGMPYRPPLPLVPLPGLLTYPFGIPRCPPY